VKMFVRHVEYFHPGVAPLPASEAHLCEFVYATAQRCAMGTVRNYVSAVRDWHVSRGLPFDTLEMPMLRRVLGGARRQLGEETKPKQALTLEDFSTIMRAHMQPLWRRAAQEGGPAVIRRLAAGEFAPGSAPRVWAEEHCVWTAALVGFFAMLRSDNLVAASEQGARNDGALLRRRDVVWDAGRAGVAHLRLEQTKTVQFRQRVVWVPLVASGGALCPVAALRLHLAINPGSAEAALFGRWDGARRWRQMTRNRFVETLKRMVAAAALNPGGFAGHSLRRGGATLAFDLEVGTHRIMTHGDWKSGAVYRYYQPGKGSRLRLPHAMAEAARGVAVPR